MPRQRRGLSSARLSPRCASSWVAPCFWVSVFRFSSVPCSRGERSTPSSSVWEINTSFAAAVALIYGYYGIVQFRLYPGARATAFVLPSLAVSFGIVALAFVLARVEYSRFMFVLSFVLGTAWFYLVLLLRSSRVKPRLALVPYGNQRDIEKLTNADWYQLTAPDEKLDGIEGVVVDLRSDLPKAWSRFVARCVLAGVPVYDVKNVSESLTGRIEIGHLSESSFGSVLPSNIYRPIKRLLDLLLVAVLALPSLVLIIVFAALIRWETPGPVFFTQPRMGYRGKTFTCWKLRSMRIGCCRRRARTSRRRMTPASPGSAASSESTASMSCRRSGTSFEAR